MDWSDLQRAVAAWSDHERVEPADAVRRVRQVAYLLHIVEQGRDRFVPLRLLIGWTLGIPFAQQGGRSIGIRDRYDNLAEMGLARIGEGSAFFDDIWERYQRHCVQLGQLPACYIGDNPRTGRVFFGYPA